MLPDTKDRQPGITRTTGLARNVGLAGSPGYPDLGRLASPRKVDDVIAGQRVSQPIEGTLVGAPATDTLPL
jgi:hypothetical protein